MLKINRKDFPILKRKINGHDLVYLDNAATSQKPIQMVKALSDFYLNHNANIHRGIHTLSEEATTMYENARRNIANFIGAVSPEEIVFTKGTTESLNRVAIGWGLKNLHEGDVVLLTDIEHHSNLVPWQEEARIVGAKLAFVESNANGEITPEMFKSKLNELAGKVKVVALTHASNVLGTILNVKEISKLAHEAGAIVVVDGAQAVPSMIVNVQSLGCDFYAFSGHKMLGPTGVGVLWGKKELLEKMEPYEFGGGMIDVVTYENSTFAPLPDKFEAGTPNVADVIGLSAAIDYLKNLGMGNIRQHEIEITSYALKKLGQIKSLKILGPKDADERTGLVAFTLEGIHSHDIASVLNSEGIAVRSGHHCNMPLYKKLGIASSTRASFYIYNTKKDIDKLVDGLKKAIKLLS